MDIISFLIGIGVLIVVLKIMLLPAKIIIKFVLNSILGGIILMICASFGLIITVYWWTVLLVGLLGIPGFVISLIITMFI
ncbi:MAG: transcriptional regulator [Clostridia bacterium]|nr:transcriptional regulator [Clostridia bacterium]